MRRFTMYAVLAVLCVGFAVEATGQRLVMPIRGLDSHQFFGDLDHTLKLLGNERFPNPDNYLIDQDLLRFERAVTANVAGPVSEYNVYIKVMIGIIHEKNVDRGRLYRHTKVNEEGSPTVIVLFDINEKPEFIAKFKYLFDGRKVIEVYRDNGSLWSTLEYGPDSLLTLNQLYDRSGNKTNHREFTYNADGAIDSATIGDSSGKKLYGVTFQYDEEGRMIGSQWFKNENLKYYTVHEHDDAGNVVKITEYNRKDNVVKELEYQFDDANNLLQMRRPSSSGPWLLEVEYNPHNRYVSTLYSKNGVTEFLEVVTHDFRNRVIDSKMFLHDAGPPKLVNHLHLNRDGYGNIVRSEVLMETNKVRSEDASRRDLYRWMFYPDVRGNVIFTYEYFSR